MHAVVVTATITPDQFEEARKHLRDNVVPPVSQAPGLVKAYWAIRDDRAQGLSFLVFKTKEDAENAAKMVRDSPPQTGVTLAAVEVREVVADT